MQRVDADVVLDRLVLPLTVSVRPCREEDLSNLEWFGCFTHHREIFRQAYERQLRGEVVMLIADLQGFPVGQAWLDLEKRRTESIGVLWAVRVLPFLRNLGIGSLLIRAAERLLHTRGMDGAELGVEKDNVEARRLYERLGYHLVGEVSEEYGYTTPDGISAHHVVDQWILRKDLDRGR